MIDTVSETVRVAPKRIAWTAIWAGVVVTLVVQLALSVLGIGVGVTSIDPQNASQSLGQGMAIGAAIWWVVSVLIALFAGGWVAGRLSGLGSRLDAALHGFLNWGVVTLVTILLLTSAIGAIIGGAMSTIGAGLQTAGQQVAQQAGGGSDQGMIGEIARLMGQGAPLRPEQLQQFAERAEPQVRQSAQQAMQDPQRSDEAFTTLIIGMTRQAVTSGQPADRDAVADLLAARTAMDPAQARSTVDRWLAPMRQASQMGQQMGQQVQQMASTAAAGVAQAAWWTFIALVLGAIISAIGGSTGSRRRDLQTV